MPISRTQLYRLMGSLMEAPADDLMIVAVKLTVLLQMASIECGEAAGFPFPQITRVLNDVCRLAGLGEQL